MAIELERPAGNRPNELAARFLRFGPARDHLLVISVLVLLTLGFFNPVLRLDETFSDVAGHQTVVFPWAAQPNGFNDAFPQSDQANAFHPWQVFLSASLRSGTAPLWNPYSFGGTPFVTNGAGGGLYPLKALLSFAFSPTWAHDLFMLLHVFLGGIAMYALLREFGAGLLGSLLSAVSWAFSSHTFGWIQLEYIGVISVCLPASLLFVHRAYRRRSLADAAIAGLVLGLSSFATVMITLIIVPIVLGYAGLLALKAFTRAHRAGAGTQATRTLLTPLVAVGATLGSAALVLLPTALMTQDIGRDPVSYSEFSTTWAVPLGAFWTALAPSSAPVSAELLHELVFVGTPTALFALLAILARRPGALLGGFLASAALLVTVGTPFTWIAYHALPGFEHFRPLGRALFVWCFALALLGGLGLDALLRWSKRPSLGWASRLLPPDLAREAKNDLERSAGRVRIAAGGLAFLAIAVSAFQLLEYGRQINPPFQPRDTAFLFPETPAIEALARDREDGPPREPRRLLPLRRDFGEGEWRQPTLWGAIAMVFGFESMGGYESLVPDRIVTLVRVVAGETPDHALDHQQLGAYLPSFFTGQTRFDLLPRLGVTTIYTPPDIADDPAWRSRPYAPLKLRELYSGPDGRVYDIAGMQPRAYVVHRIERVNGPRDALRRFADESFDFRRFAVLESGEPAEIDTTGVRSAVSRSQVSATHLGTNTESYRVSAERPGLLVVASMWDRGWEATVDGRPAKVLRANYNLRAVEVPEGTSRVEFEYRARGLELGGVITGGTLLASAIGLGAGVWRRRSNVMAKPTQHAA